MNKDLTESDGYLTPSQKLKRSKILKDFSAYVDDMYSRVSSDMGVRLERLQEIKEQASEKLHEYAEHASERIEELREQASERLQGYQAARAQKTESTEQVEATAVTSDTSRSHEQ